MTKSLEQVRDQLAEKYIEELYQRPGQMELRDEELMIYKAGFNAAIKHLEREAGEFDEALCQAILEERYKPLSELMSVEQALWREGARWQFEQDRARIGLAESKYISVVDRYSKAADKVLGHCPVHNESDDKTLGRQLVDALKEANAGHDKLYMNSDQSAEGLHMNSKPREWWIVKDGTWQEYKWTPQGMSFPLLPAEHVIEYSAYASLAEELTKAKQQRDEWNVKANRFQKALKGLLADTQHSDHHCGDSGCPVEIARQALATYE